MAQTMVNFRMDTELKKKMEKACSAYFGKKMRGRIIVTGRLRTRKP